MEGALPQTFAPVEDDDLVTSAAKRWIASARLNINARQVFPPGFKRPVSGQAA
jgi:alkylated DNA repair protein alkB family protein 1